MRLNINEVVPGMILDAAIVKDDVLLVNKREILTISMINRLKDFGITSIDIVSNRRTSDFTIDDKLMQEVRDALLSNDGEKIKNSANDMVTAILRNFQFNGNFSNFKYDLQSYEEYEDSLTRAIRVATFSIVLGHLFNEKLINSFKTLGEKNAGKINLRDLAAAALLYEKGRNHYDNSVLDKVNKLASSSKVCEIAPGIKDVPTDKFDDKYISVYSFCLANDMPELPSNVKYMILYSAEMENGRGPLRAKGFNKENSKGFFTGAKIIHLCKMYDDYLAHCVHCNESFENTISVLGQAASHGVVNAELASLFFNNVPIYSVGNMVDLSTGEKAVVEQAFTKYLYTTRPVVRTVPGNRIIDLRDENAITILGISQEHASVDELVNGQLNEIDKRGSRK